MIEQIVNDLYRETQDDFFKWFKEQNLQDVQAYEIEEFFGATMYGYLVDLHRKYKVSEEQIGYYVKMTNDFIEQQLMILEYRKNFYSIDLLEEPRRTLRLSELMDKMQQEFNIPLLNNEAYNEKHLQIMELYRQISNEREF